MEAFDIPALHALCIELSIPGPAAEACLAQAASAQAAPLLRHIPALLDASRAEAAMRELQAKCAPLSPNGLLELAVLLSAALEARKHYAARGVPDARVCPPARDARGGQACSPARDARGGQAHYPARDVPDGRVFPRSQGVRGAPGPLPVRGALLSGWGRAPQSSPPEWGRALQSSPRGPERRALPAASPPRAQSRARRFPEYQRAAPPRGRRECARRAAGALRSSGSCRIQVFHAFP